MQEPDGAGQDTPPRSAADPGARTWVHPSEVGLHSRTRTDRRRGAWLSAGLVLTGAGLLAFGVAMGFGSTHRVAATRTGSPDAIAASLAQVTVVRGAQRRTVTGVVLDHEGHVAVRAAAIAGADEVWAGFGGTNARKVTDIVRDGDVGLAVVTTVDRVGRPAPAEPSPVGVEEVLLARVGTGEAAPSVERARIDRGDPVGDAEGSGGVALIQAVASDTGSATTTTLAVGSAATATIVTTSGPSSSSTTTSDGDGAAFDARGNFVGLIIRADGRHRDILPAATVMRVARGMSR